MKTGSPAGAAETVPARPRSTARLQEPPPSPQAQGGTYPRDRRGIQPPRTHKNLSELEAGRRNATLETLYALTTALGTHLSAVLGSDPARAPLSGRAVDAVLVERYEDPAAITEVYRIRIRPGAVQESDAHPSGTEEHLIVLSGTARVCAASAPVEAGPGEHAHWPADIPHVYAAVSGHVEAVLTVRYPAC